MLGIFNERLKLALGTNKPNSAAARIIHLQHGLSTNGTKESFVPFYRH